MSYSMFLQLQIQVITYKSLDSKSVSLKHLEKTLQKREHFLFGSESSWPHPMVFAGVLQILLMCTTLKEFCLSRYCKLSN
jgi:hypothetical protein